MEAEIPNMFNGTSWQTSVLRPRTNILTAEKNRSIGLRGWNSGRSPMHHYGDRVISDLSFKNARFELPSRTRSTFITAFSPDNSLLASCHGDHNIHILDVKTKALVKSLSGHERSPWCVTFHPGSNEILASGSLNGEVRVWDLRGDGSESWIVNSNELIAVASLSFHPYDHVLAIAAGNEIHFWDWSLSQPFASVKTSSENEKVRFVRFDPWGHSIITGVANAEEEEEENEDPTFDHWSWLFPITRVHQTRPGDSRPARFRHRRRNHNNASRETSDTYRTTGDEFSSDVRERDHSETRRLTTRWPTSGRRGHRLFGDRDASRVRWVPDTNDFSSSAITRPSPRMNDDVETNEDLYGPSRSSLSQAHQRILHARVSVNAEIQQQYSRLQLLRQERHRLEMRLRELQNSANEVRNSTPFLMNDESALDLRHTDSGPATSSPGPASFAASISSRLREQRQRFLDSLSNQPTTTTSDTTSGNIVSSSMDTSPAPDSSFLAQLGLESHTTSTSQHRHELQGSFSEIESPTTAPSFPSEPDLQASIYASLDPEPRPQISPIPSSEPPSLSDAVSSQDAQSELWDEALRDESSFSRFESNLMSLANTAERLGEMGQDGTGASRAADSFPSASRNEDENELMEIEIPDVQVSTTIGTRSGGNGGFIDFQTPINEQEFEMSRPQNIQMDLSRNSEERNLLSERFEFPDRQRGERPFDPYLRSPGDRLPWESPPRSSGEPPHDSELTSLYSLALSAAQAAQDSTDGVRPPVSSRGGIATPEQRIATPSAPPDELTGSQMLGLSPPRPLDRLFPSHSHDASFSRSLTNSRPTMVQLAPVTSHPSLMSFGHAANDVAATLRSDSPFMENRPSVLQTAPVSTYPSLMRFSPAANGNITTVQSSTPPTVIGPQVWQTTSASSYPNSTSISHAANAIATTMHSANSTTASRPSVLQTAPVASDASPATFSRVTADDAASISSAESLSRAVDSLIEATDSLTEAADTLLREAATSASNLTQELEDDNLDFNLVPWLNSSGTRETSDTGANVVVPPVPRATNRRRTRIATMRDSLSRRWRQRSAFGSEPEDGPQTNRATGANSNTWRPVETDTRTPSDAAPGFMADSWPSVPAYSEIDLRSRRENVPESTGGRRSRLVARTLLRTRPRPMSPPSPTPERPTTLMQLRDEATPRNITNMILGAVGQAVVRSRVGQEESQSLEGSSHTRTRTGPQIGTEEVTESVSRRTLGYSSPTPSSHPPTSSFPSRSFLFGQASPNAIDRHSPRLWNEVQPTPPTTRPPSRPVHNTLRHQPRSQRHHRLRRQYAVTRSNINRIISSVYAENNGHRAVVLNIDSTTYRLQWWDFTQLKLPEISRSDINLIVPHCKIYNDASIDISKDGQLLATFVPSFVGYPDSMMNVGIFSLEPSTFGQLLFKKAYGPNAVCLSISPLCNHVCVGLKSRQFLLGELRQNKHLMAQILEIKKGNSDEMPVSRHVYHPSQDRPHRVVSINTISWVPEVGGGIVYGTNTGDLRMCYATYKRLSAEDDLQYDADPL